MMPIWTTCFNCGATLEINTSKCDRCGECAENPGTGRPRFLKQTREAAEDLGGLLKLYVTDGLRVKYVAWCPAGALGIDADGRTVWIVDFGYMGRVSVDNEKLHLDGKLADIDTGQLL